MIHACMKIAKDFPNNNSCSVKETSEKFPSLICSLNTDLIHSGLDSFISLNLLLQVLNLSSCFILTTLKNLAEDKTEKERGSHHICNSLGMTRGRNAVKQ